MKKKLFIATIINMLLSAFLWFLFGWLATISNTHAEVKIALPEHELRQQVDAYDRRILLKGMAAWAFAGALTSLAVMTFYMTSPSLNAPRHSLVFAILLGVANGLLFALWYYPRMNLEGTTGALASTPVRVVMSCFLALLTSFLCGAFSVARLRHTLRGT